MSATVRRLRPVKTLGQTLVGLLALDVVLAVVMVTLRLSEMGLLQRAARGELVSFEEATRSDDRVGAVAIAELVSILVTGVVWLVWQHRAHSNLHAAHLPQLRFTPGWAVGWWLIPFANLAKPFQSVRELWKASSGHESWRQIETWSVIGWWWALWILMLVLERAATVVFNGAATLDTVISSSRLFLAREVVVIIATVLAIAIVRSVGGRQRSLIERPVPETMPPPRPDTPPMPEI